MINKKCAKSYCSEDISLIENYELAISDTQKWVCHHRLECVNGIFTSPAELIKKGLYKKRPSAELIFLTAAEHRALHNKDPKLRKKISDSLKGQPTWCKGKKFSEEHKKRISEARIGKSSGMLDKKFWNNGLINNVSKERPGPEWQPGRLKRS